MYKKRASFDLPRHAAIFLIFAWDFRQKGLSGETPSARGKHPQKQDLVLKTGLQGPTFRGRRYFRTPRLQLEDQLQQAPLWHVMNPRAVAPVLEVPLPHLIDDYRLFRISKGHH